MQKTCKKTVKSTRIFFVTCLQHIFIQQIEKLLYSRQSVNNFYLKVALDTRGDS